MAAYNSTYTGAQHDAYVTKSALVDLIYPVGAIYISTNSTSPQTLFGGTWEQIQDTFLLAAGSTYTAGNTGGKASYTAADMPAHKHDRGTMDIQGSLNGADCTFGTYNSHGAGAFYTTGSRGNYMFGRGGVDVNSPNYRDIAFSAARNWSGETSQSGTNETATILPPHLVVYMWKRIS